MGAATTPARIRAWSLVIVAAMVLAAAADVTAVSRRHHAVTVFGTRSEPLVVIAQRIQTELDQADASAANAFLAGGIEPADQRAAYQQAIRGVATDIANAAAATGQGSASVATLAQQLPIYSGLVEQARAGNRQGFPVGAAYLRDASQLLRSQMVPAAGSVAQANAGRLNRGQRDATSWSDVAIVLVVAVLLLAALVFLQLFITRRTRRAINVGLALGTAVVLVVTALVLAGMGSERSDVVAANDHGYTAAAQLARARALAYQAQADDAEALIAQGNGQSFLADFTSSAAAVTTLLGADLTSAQAFAVYQQRHQAIVAADAAGRHADAVALALQAGAGSARAAFASFDQQLQSAFDQQQIGFTGKVGSADRHLNRLTLIAILGMIVAALLALAGAQTRINEYR